MAQRDFICYLLAADTPNGVRVPADLRKLESDLAEAGFSAPRLGSLTLDDFCRVGKGVQYAGKVNFEGTLSMTVGAPTLSVTCSSQAGDELIRFMDKYELKPAQ